MTFCQLGLTVSASKMLTVPSSDNLSNSSRDGASAGLALVGNAGDPAKTTHLRIRQSIDVQQMCSVFIGSVPIDQSVACAIVVDKHREVSSSDTFLKKPILARMTGTISKNPMIWWRYLMRGSLQH